MSKGNFWPRGKLLGGSGAINGAVYMRGNPKDFDEWEKLGNTGWGWQNVLQYFKKSEDFTAEHLAADTKNHQTGGPMKVSVVGDKNFDHPARKVYAGGMMDLGYKFGDDFVEGHYIGLAPSQSNQYNGVRWSTAKGFLSSSKDRENLHVIKRALVTKININSDKTVTGVEFTVEGQTKMTARASKEVILTAGAINTPKLLMTSGIGPKEHLEELGIDVLKDLPVGYNLQDHVIVPFMVSFKKLLMKPYTIEDSLIEYFGFLMNRTGHSFASIGGPQLMSFISTINDPTYPDVQYHFFFFKKDDPFVYNLYGPYGYDKYIIESLLNENSEHEIGAIATTLLNPKSIGRITLKSKDPYEKPIIDSKYLNDKQDMDTTIRSIRITQKLTQTSTFKNANVDFFKVNLPECENYTFDSDEYWKCYAEHMASTLYHPAGTARMGPATDPRSVVDPTLKVIGIDGLRVADASIMPNVVSANTNAACVMIAEKAADLIKADWDDYHEEL